MPGWIEIVLRSFIYLTVLFFFTKWLGKRQLSQMSIFEVISSIVLGGIVAFHSSALNSPVMHGLISMFIWFLIPLLVKMISLKRKDFRGFFQGERTVLIENGKVLENNLKKEKFSTDDLLEGLREKSIFQVADVEFATLEPSGKLSVLVKKEHQPLTAKTIGLKVPPEKPPQTVIMDGIMLLEPLASISLNPNWLEAELDKLNVSIENVFIGQVDSDGQLTVDLYDDKIEIQEPNEKPLLLASMKKCQADLELFALASENEQSKKIYEKNSQKLQQAIDLITPYLS